MTQHQVDIAVLFFFSVVGLYQIGELFQDPSVMNLLQLIATGIIISVGYMVCREGL